MKVLKYQGRNVYTQSNTEVRTSDLASAEVKPGQIIEGYFFEVDEDRKVHKTGFDRRKVDNNSSGLMVDINIRSGGQAGVSIAGLQEIVEFMGDFDCMGKDLSTLKGRKVDTYNRGMHLLGFSKKQA